MTDFDESVPDESEQLDQLDPEQSLTDTDLDDPLERGYAPPDRWSAGEGFGNTAAEMAEGESLDQRLAQEEPDVDAEEWGDNDLDDGEVGGRRAGRLVDPDHGSGVDDEADLVGEDVGIDGAGASAEEAAVHVIPDDPADADSPEQPGQV